MILIFISLIVSLNNITNRLTLRLRFEINKIKPKQCLRNEPKVKKHRKSVEKLGDRCLSSFHISFYLPKWLRTQQAHVGPMVGVARKWILSWFLRIRSPRYQFPCFLSFLNAKVFCSIVHMFSISLKTKIHNSEICHDLYLHDLFSISYSGQAFYPLSKRYHLLLLFQLFYDTLIRRKKDLEESEDHPRVVGTRSLLIGFLYASFN